MRTVPPASPHPTQFAPHKSEQPPHRTTPTSEQPTSSAVDRGALPLRLSPLQLLDTVWVDCCVSSVCVSRRLHASMTDSHLILSATPAAAAPSFLSIHASPCVLLFSCCRPAAAALLLSKRRAVHHRPAAAFVARCCLLLSLAADRRCCCCASFGRASSWFSFVIARCASVGTVIVDKSLIVLLNRIIQY